MEEILKQDKSRSHKEFEKLLSEDLSNRKLKEGEIITGVVSSIGEKHIFIDISAKSEGVIPIEEFNEEFESTLSDKDFDTLGGIVTHHFARFPKINDAISIDNLRFIITSTEKRRLKKIKVIKS